MSNIYSVEQIKDLLNKAEYDGRPLTEKEKQELLERWRSSVMSNRGIRDFIDDKDITDEVPYLEYSAICDDRSCEFCSGHNGEVLKIDDPRVEENSPPIHLGCRCSWIPIIQLEVDDLVAAGGVKFKWSDIEKPDFSLVTL